VPDKSLFEVVSPLGEEQGQQVEATSSGSKMLSPATAVSNLHAKKIGLVWTNFRNGDVLLEAFADLLGQRYVGLEFVKLQSGRELQWGDHPDKTLADVARESGIEAAIVAPGC